MARQRKLETKRRTLINVSICYDTSLKNEYTSQSRCSHLLKILPYIFLFLYIFSPVFSTTGIWYSVPLLSIPYIIQTALLNNLKPEKYLEYVFNQFQINVDYVVKDLMLWSEKIPENCKNKLQK